MAFDGQGIDDMRALGRERRIVVLGAAGPRVSALVRPGPRPVLFVHGFAASGAYFAEAPERPELAGRGVVVLDLPGFGASEAPDGFAFTMAEQASVVARVAEALDLAEIALVGHSMGGTIAVLAAELLGARVHDLFAVEAVLQHEPSAWTTRIADGAPEAWAAELARLQGKPEIFARGSMLRRRRDAIARVAPAVLETTARATYLSARSLRDTAADPTLYGRFLALPCQRRYVFGDRNLDVALYGRLAADEAPLAVVPHAGHLMMLDNPDAFYALVAAGAGAP